MSDITKLKVNNSTYNIKDSVARTITSTLQGDVLNIQYDINNINNDIIRLGNNIPTKTSDLTNDSGYITKDVNDLTNYTLTSDLSSVATSGSYNDLSNKPTIPTKTSQLTNDSNFATTTYVDNSISPINQNLNGNPTISDKNSSITLSNTLNAPMELDLFGNTSQEGTPTPSSPQPISVVSGNNSINICKKNLLSPTDFAQRVIDTPYNANYQSTYDSETGILNCNMGNDGVVFDNFKENTQYTLILKYNITNGVGMNLKVVYTNNTTSIITVSETGSGTLKYTTASGKSVKSIIHYAGNSSGARNLYLFESGIFEGDIETTAFEPYTGQTYPINLGTNELCKIGDYEDSIFYNTTDTNLDLNSWYIKKEIDKVVLDGSEDWYASGTLGYIINMSQTSPFNDKKLDVFLGYCNYFEYITSAYTWSKLYGCGFNSSGTFWIRDDNNLANSVDNWKTWLSTHNTTVYYILSSPTYTKITDTTLLQQLNDLKKAKSYNIQTNITQVNNDKPFIINATAFLNNQNGRYNYLNKKTDYIVENENLIL